ncbi:Zinc finger protein SNAI1 [Echinococcus granulosus]|uniref:Zinc finger protein SNAI1 n=1 Tax=Echinococcus granulosus TaxID=6210 RepID=W6UZL0_ECHGR|nr:Zinc finger protein SNAI1 [Echinococcus granulosus]EUB63942.1 Zinc finger protein SNAI1 [Echinococcus granulosus]
MKYDFSIASLLKLSPTAREAPELTNSIAKDEAAYTCARRTSNSFDMVSILSSSSSAPAGSSSSTLSTILVDTFNTSSISQLKRGDGGQIYAIGLSMLSSSKPAISPPSSSTSSVAACPQFHTSPVNACEIALQTYACLSWWHSFYSATLPNLPNTSVANPTDVIVNFPTGRIAVNTASGGTNDNAVNHNGIGSSARIGEVDNDKEVEEGERAVWRCRKCGKTHNSSACLRMHKRSHLRPWKCGYCEKAFSRNWLLEGHERTHTGEKPFVCPTCQRAFADRSNMRAHTQTHLTVKRCRCPHCPRSFTRRSLLIRHLEKCAFATTAPTTVMNDAPTTFTKYPTHDLDTINPTN